MSNGLDSFSERMKKRLATQGWGQAPLRSAPSRSGEPTASLTSVQLPSKGLGEDHTGVVWTDFKSSHFNRGVMRIVGGLQTDEIALRSALLFSDIVDIPSNNTFHYTQQTVDLIKPFNILQSTRCLYNGSDYAATQRNVFDAYDELGKREPGRWTIARGLDSLPIPEGVLGRDNGFALTINDALPVFGREVPLEHVLEFKNKRKAELLALRTHMQQLIQQAVDSGVNDIAGSGALEQFDRSLADYMRTMVESNAHKVMASFQASVSFDIVIPAFVELALTHTATGAGVLGGAATVGFKTVRGLIGRKEVNPFEYLTIASRELY